MMLVKNVSKEQKVSSLKLNLVRKDLPVLNGIQIRLTPNSQKSEQKGVALDNIEKG